MAKEFKSIGEKAAARFMGSSPVNASDSKEIVKESEIPKKAQASNTKKIEIKSERINLRIKPSVKKNLEKLAIMEGRNINNLIDHVLGQYIRKNKELLETYDLETSAIQGKE